LHAGAVWNDKFLVFGGYDGHHRVNDLYAYHFGSNHWQPLVPTAAAGRGSTAPSPRDRHVAAVFENYLYIFGGFDGLARVNDLHAFDLLAAEWHLIAPSTGSAPSPRHSHAAVVYRSSMFVFGGYDGSYRNDFHEYHFLSRIWSPVPSTGDCPRARYRGTCVVSGDQMVLHGGHDGNRHLQDTHIFDFSSRSWSALTTEGPAPSPRDSHVSVMFGKSMFLYGGSTGSAMGDFHELVAIDNHRYWTPVTPHNGHPPVSS
jgi:N-acetylneuraminic acid mutarotase